MVPFEIVETLKLITKFDLNVLLQEIQISKAN